MTKFEDKSDAAARSLRERMGLSPSAPVAVDAQGRQKTEPPEGSYAAMAIEQQRARAAAQRATAQPQPVEPGPVDEQEPAEPATSTNAAQQDAPGEEGTSRLSKRFSELTAARREAERKAAEEAAARRDMEQRVAALEAERQALIEDRRRLQEAQLESLDPETRARVLAEASARQIGAEVERGIFQKIAPTLHELQRREREREVEQIANRYPAFDQALHLPLMDQFLSRNPACTLEQAFRAVAEPSELTIAEEKRATPRAPAVVTPRATSGGGRYQPAAPKEKSEEERRQEEVSRLRELSSSHDPAQRREADRHLRETLARRLSRGGRPA